MVTRRSLRHPARVANVLCALLLAGCSPDPGTPLENAEPHVDFTYLECGGLGEQCCRPPASAPTNPTLGPPVSCEKGLGCDVAANVCVSPCGGSGQVCCDGPETRSVKWTKEGLPYGSVDWNLRPMCLAGACDVQSHRCFTCGIADGQPCCPPDAERATARCTDDGLYCEWNEEGMYESGTCRACGIRGKPPCHWGCEEPLGELNKLCDFCGRDGQPRCDNGCKPGLGLGIVRGLCRVCGEKEQIPCDISGCRRPYGVINGMCGVCGGQGGVPCDTGCGSGMRLIDGKCTFCGNVGQPPCEQGCNFKLGVAGGKCRTCGGLGQMPCDLGCEQGLIPSGNHCVPPPGLPPPPECAGEGQNCMADWLPGPHCCRTGAPLLCGYNQCRACVPHGMECGQNQTCCSADDHCVLDPALDKQICDLVDLPEKK